MTSHAMWKPPLAPSKHLPGKRVFKQALTFAWFRLSPPLPHIFLTPRTAGTSAPHYNWHLLAIPFSQGLFARAHFTPGNQPVCPHSFTPSPSFKQCFLHTRLHRLPVGSIFSEFPPPQNETRPLGLLSREALTLIFPLLSVVFLSGLCITPLDKSAASFASFLSFGLLVSY